MKIEPNVLVVGGGPVGCFAAFHLAKLGVGTTVFEEHAEIGVPSHCAGHLSIRSLKKVGLYPLPSGVVENTFSAANFYSPKGFKFSVRLSRPVTCAVNRELFDKFLSKKAENAGAHFHLESRVRALIIENGFVTGLISEKGNTGETRTTAKIVVDAEGISSKLLRERGLSMLNRDNLVYAVEAEVENVKDVEPDAVEVYLGTDYAPSFYAWLIPKRDGAAKVGLATKSGNAKDYLQRLMRKHPVASKQLAEAKITQMSFHPITLGGPIPQAYSNGFLAVGDVASQVKPTTGGGVIFGLTCARIAAEVASEAIQKNNVSSGFLQLYQRRFGQALGFDLSVMLRIRRFLDSLSDQKIDDALRFCQRIGLAEALTDVDEIDFQGQTLLKMLKKPNAVAALVYFLLLYLSVNP